uniref:Uncharacterized protein n=1 Tax=Pyramimonas obovata TaxID=1411642 RepID=A0A7S0WIA0_9CHLO
MSRRLQRNPAFRAMMPRYVDMLNEIIAIFSQKQAKSDSWTQSRYEEVTEARKQVLMETLHAGSPSRLHFGEPATPTAASAEPEIDGVMVDHSESVRSTPEAKAKAIVGSAPRTPSAAALPGSIVSPGR